MLPRICRCCGLVIAAASLGNPNICSACASVGLEDVSSEVGELTVDLAVPRSPDTRLSRPRDFDPQTALDSD